mmetsp:Transcript_67835/g.150293  ORF Transcript_67835/g.150293 Transcript_67835/m.150293 type:complete len:504 (-) Transcript_67835:19-1530(-)
MAALRLQDASAGQAQAADAVREAEEAFPALFPVHAPRDVLGGLWSGIKCVLGGLLVGMAGVIAQPIEGAREDGLLGCFRGVGVGLLAGLFLSITGLCTGVFQTLRGVAATPRAICMASQGWTWDAETGTWKEPQVYSLPEEAERVLIGDDDDADAGEPARRSRVVDTYYYDQLGVATTATQQQIRKAYFSRSRQCHPDKTSEENAKERFQSISEAYQVLSDSKRRRDYDLHGKDGKESFVDAKIFFDVLLGADALAPYVGRLRITEMFGQELFQQHSGSEEDQAHVQLRRQVKLAVALASKLDALPQTPNGLAEAQAEAEGIVEKDPSLARFISEIGWVYCNRAEWYLASSTSALGAWSVGALSSRAQGRGHQASQQVRTAKLAAHSFVKLRRIVKEADQQDAESAQATEELPESLSSALPTFMETFWSVSSHDITGTLDKVIERVLSDCSIDDVGRRKRAEALKELGGALRKAGEAEASQAAPGEECRRFEKAFVASMARET